MQPTPRHLPLPLAVGRRHHPLSPSLAGYRHPCERHCRQWCLRTPNRKRRTKPALSRLVMEAQHDRRPELMRRKFHSRKNTFHLCSRMDSSPPSPLNLNPTAAINPPPPGCIPLQTLRPELIAPPFFATVVFLWEILGRKPSMAGGMDVDKFPAGMRVLAVDDDRISLMILERQLQHCNYNVTTVMVAEKALDMLRERKNGDQFDLVISDVVMPGIDGFKLLELISLEMDIPVIMLSANDEVETMMKGIKHGACDYLVKPVRLEQLKNIWTHVVKKGTANDAAAQKLQSGDDKGEKGTSSQTTKCSKKNKNDADDTEEVKENTSTQKRQRIQWSSQLHRNFVDAVNQIGMNRAVPKRILEVMNVDGLTRENVASHLQKYRIYLKKLDEGTLKDSTAYVDEPQAWQSVWKSTNNNMNAVKTSNHHPEVGRYQPSPSFASSSKSCNPFARMIFPSAFGTHSLLPTHSVELMNSERRLCVPLQNMEPVCSGINLPKDAMTGPVQNVSKFISSGNSYASTSSGELSGPSSLTPVVCSRFQTSQCIPSGPSGSSFANISKDVVFNTSKPFYFGTAGNSFANISNGSSLATSFCSHSRNSYPSMLHGNILEANRGIPFDAGGFFESMENSEMLAPSSHLPSQSPSFGNQPSVQIQSSSTGLFNSFAREAHQFAGLSNSFKDGVPSKFPGFGHNGGTSKGPSQGSSIKINQISTFTATSGQVPTSGNEFQNQMAGPMGTTAPMVGFGEQVTPFNLGSNINSAAISIDTSALGSASSIRPMLPNLQIDNSVMPAEMLNGGDASRNLPDDGTTCQQAVGYQVNNNNEFPVGTAEAQNEANGDFDDFFADWIDQDFLSDDSFMDRSWNPAP